MIGKRTAAALAAAAVAAAVLAVADHEPAPPKGLIPEDWRLGCSADGQCAMVRAIYYLPCGNGYTSIRADRIAEHRDLEARNHDAVMSRWGTIMGDRGPVIRAVCPAVLDLPDPRLKPRCMEGRCELRGVSGS